MLVTVEAVAWTLAAIAVVLFVLSLAGWAYILWLRARLKEEIGSRDTLLYVLLEAERRMRKAGLIRERRDGEVPGYWLRDEMKS